MARHFSPPLWVFVFCGVALAWCSDVGAQESLAQNWKDFLDGADVFGDFGEAEFDLSMAATSRKLISESEVEFGAAKAPSEKQFRAYNRALWVGVNLEYQASLRVTNAALRREHAQKALSYLKKLRWSLQDRPAYKFEDIQDAVAQRGWQKALIIADAMERELLGISSGDPEAAALLARRAVFEEFDPSNEAENSPNEMLMRDVTESFATARRVAKQAISAAVQGSLTAAAAHGRPPMTGKENNENEMGLPSPTVDDWNELKRIIGQTDSGTKSDGVLGMYGTLAARKVQADGEALLFKEGLETKKKDLEAAFGLTKLKTDAEKSFQEIRKLAQKASLPAIPNGVADKPLELPETLKDDARSQDGADGNMKSSPLSDYRRRLEGILFNESVAQRQWKEIKPVVDGWRKGGAQPVPVSEPTLDDLILIAREVAIAKFLGMANNNTGPWRDEQKLIKDGKLDGSAENEEQTRHNNERIRAMQQQAKARGAELIREWLHDWLSTQVQKEFPNIPDELSKKITKTTSSQRSESNSAPADSGKASGPDHSGAAPASTTPPKEKQR